MPFKPRAVCASLLGAATLLLAACGGNAADNVTAAQIVAVPAPNGGQWSDVVAQTPDGGIRMGNPHAAIRLVEYGSLTCPHCAAFARTATDPLVARYVATGKLSYEFRPFVRDAVDVTASLLLLCSGPSAFFPMLGQFYADQPNWFARAQAQPPAVTQALAAMNPRDQVNRYADITGLRSFVSQRGLPRAAVTACLNDTRTAERLSVIQQTASDTYQIQQTPSFLINDVLLTDVATWPLLEAQLKQAGA